MLKYKCGIANACSEVNLDEDQIQITTIKHFEWYKQSIKYYLKFFNLENWEVDIVHDELVEGSKASCLIYDTPRSVSFGLSRTFFDYEKLNRSRIDKFAFHEVMELHYFNVGRLAIDRNFILDDLERETHNNIRTMENVIWDLVKDKKIK